ncbi:MAG: hypothetical protein Q9159_000097 [Coniocarpon cinnabarinum]
MLPPPRPETDDPAQVPGTPSDPRHSHGYSGQPPLSPNPDSSLVVPATQAANTNGERAASHDAEDVRMSVETYEDESQNETQSVAPMNEEPSLEMEQGRGDHKYDAEGRSSSPSESDENFQDSEAETQEMQFPSEEPTMEMGDERTAHDRHSTNPRRSDDALQADKKKQADLQALHGLDGDGPTTDGIPKQVSRARQHSHKSVERSENAEPSNGFIEQYDWEDLLHRFGAEMNEKRAEEQETMQRYAQLQLVVKAFESAMRLFD